MIKNTKIQKFFYLIAFLCFGYNVILNLYDFINNYIPDWVNIFKSVNHKEYIVFLCVFLVLIVFLITLLSKKNNGKLYIKSPVIIAAIIFILSFSIKYIFISLVNTQQYSDFQLFYWVTANIAEKVPKYLTQSYFSVWAYQVGFPAAMSPVLMIFGTSIKPLIVTNCFFMSITNVFVYLICRQLTGEKASRLASFAYAFFPFTLSLSSVYTNQHLALMLFCIGFFILTYKNSLSIIRSLLAGIFFAFGNMVRPEGIIIILSMLVFGIVAIFIKTNYKDNNTLSGLKGIFLPIICVLVIFFAANSLISQFFISSSLNPHGLSNNFPLYKFVVGLNHSTKGTFSKEDSDYLFESQYFKDNPQLRDQEAIRIIKERLSVEPKKMLSLFNEKSKTMWTTNPMVYPSFIGYDFKKDIALLNLKIPSKLLLLIFSAVDFLFFVVIYSFCAITMLSSLRSKENSMIQILLTIMFLAMFFIHLFIEVQHRYSYFIFAALFVLASLTLNNISKQKRA